jgi:hypothetical protein
MMPFFALPAIAGYIFIVLTLFFSNMNRAPNTAHVY